MKQLNVILLLVVCLVKLGHAQEVVMYSGLSHNLMGDQRHYRTLFMEAAGVDKKILQDFPMHFRYGGMLHFKVASKMSLGLDLSTTSTGSRFAYRDYTGNAGLDQTLRAVMVGPNFRYWVHDRKNFRVAVYKASGLIFTNLKMFQYASYGSENHMARRTFKSINVFDEYGFAFSYFRDSPVSLFGNFGIQVNSCGNLTSSTSKGDSAWYVEDPESFGADWSGVKMNVGVHFSLH